MYRGNREEIRPLFSTPYPLPLYRERGREEINKCEGNILYSPPQNLLPFSPLVFFAVRHLFTAQVSRGVSQSVSESVNALESYAWVMDGVVAETLSLCNLNPG